MSALRCEGMRVEAVGRVLVRDGGFTLHSGEVLGLVGASGSGKTLLLRALLDLVPAPARRVAGEVWVDDRAVSPRSLRGGTVGLLFQDARASLDPLSTVGAAVAHSASLAGFPGAGPAPFLARAGFDTPAEVVGRFPHELSGGMSQRAAVACALARRSPFLLCDEPTTGLDAHVQVALLAELRALATGRPGVGDDAEPGRGILFVTHDIDLLEGFADRVLVMEGGSIVDEAATAAGLRGPGRSLVEAARVLRRRAG